MLQQAVLHNGIKTRTCFILISGDKWNFIIPFCSLSDNCRIGWGNSMRLEALVTCSLISGCTSRQWRHTVHHCRWTVPSHRRSPWPWPAWRGGRRCRGPPAPGRSQTCAHPAAGRPRMTGWAGGGQPHEPPRTQYFIWTTFLMKQATYLLSTMEKIFK